MRIIIKPQQSGSEFIITFALMKKIVNNSWFISIASSVFVALLGIEAIPLGKINNWMNYEIPLWWILIAVLLGIGLYVSIQKVHRIPKFTRITTGEYGGYHWSWSWEKTGNGYALTDLDLLCPRCNQVMHCGFYCREYTCPQNHMIPISNVSSISLIHKAILRDIRERFPENQLQIINKEEQ